MREGLSGAGVKAVLVAVVISSTSPVLTHATGRAARIRQLARGFGGLPPFGRYQGPYGDVVNSMAIPSRRVTEAVSALGAAVLVPPTFLRRRLVIMLATAIGLLLAALVWGLVPGLVDTAQDGAAVFANGDAYASAVLGPARDAPVQTGPAPSHAGSGALIGIVSAFGALAALGLFRRRLVPSAIREWTVNILKPPLLGLRGLHSGHVGDYVTWIVVGVSLLGGWLALAS